MSEAITVEGGRELSASLARAADQFGDMERPGERAADLLASRGRIEAPRLTGALASSITPEVDGNTAAVMSALPYAARTHYGYARYNQRAQPFLTDPLVQLEGTYVDYYADEADRILHTVKGA